jgi:transposase-like protein
MDLASQVMPRSSIYGAEFWATVVAEARRATIPLSQVAAKHGVTDAALRYQLYKAPRRASTKSDALALLPVRLSRAMAKQVEVELGPASEFASKRAATRPTWRRSSAGCFSNC